jgi:hypothetical protein
MKRDHWNRCDVCGRFIAIRDFLSGKATRELVTPDTEFTCEEFETLHLQCSQPSVEPSVVEPLR